MALQTSHTSALATEPKSRYNEALLSQGRVHAGLDIVSDLQIMDEQPIADTPETQAGQV